MSEQLLVTRDGGIVTLTLNNPERMNPFSREIRDGLIENFTALNADETCRAIILTGAGPNFSAGADLNKFNENTVKASRERIKAGATPLMRAMVAGSKPIIGAIEGYAYGAGLALTAACDYVVATPATKFCCAFTRVGFLPDLGLLWTLPKRVGMGRAKHLIALARQFDGTQAKEYGLVDELAEPGKALDAARAVAQEFAAGPPLAFEFVKSIMAADGTLEDALRAEVDLQPYLMLSEDHAEGKKAFFEKRKPQFKGR